MVIDLIVQGGTSGYHREQLHRRCVTVCNAHPGYDVDQPVLSVVGPNYDA